MLSYVTMENFKSFKNKTRIDLKKTNYTILPQNVSDSDLLKGLVFVGANGSGKSTVLEAIRLLLNLMFAESNISLTMYKSLLTERKDFTLGYGFIVNGDEIEYQISYSLNNRSFREELKKNSKLIFYRDGKDARSYFNDTEVVYNENTIKPDGLFLRALHFNSQLVQDSTLASWMDFLNNSKYVTASPTENDFKELTGAYNEYYENGGIEKINNFLDTINYGQKVFFADYVKGDFYEFNSTEKMLFYERDGVHMPVPFLNESLGNRTLIKVLSSYLPVLEEGGILLVDEFSAGFHATLQHVLIKYFMEKSVNSQIIIVSHSVPMLSNSLLRPDQEYAVEFNGVNGSEIMRFSDKQPRNSQNISKMYLSGVFGGKPIYEENFEV